MKNATRREREEAMKLLYEMDMTGEVPSVASQIEADGTEITLPHDSDVPAQNEKDANDSVFAHTVLSCFPKLQSEIDDLISSNSHRWKLERISKVDLAILRLAIFEMMYLHTPQKIAINEAVELSKKYSGENAYKFVNGVLAGYTRTNGSSTQEHR